MTDAPAVATPRADVSLADIVEAVSFLRAENARLVSSLADEHDLGTSDMRAVYFIFSNPGITAKQVTERLGMTTGATTALLDRLDRRGFIERRPNPADRRSVLLYALAAGERMMAHNLEVYSAALTPALVGVDLGLLEANLHAMANAFAEAAARR